MEYCHSCGLRVNSEDVFCPNCGTKLVRSSESEKKETTQTQFNANQQQSVEHTNSTNSNVKETTYQLANSFNAANSKIVMDVLVKMLLKPVFGAKEFIEKGKKNSVIVITILLAFMQGLLGVWKVNQFFSTLENMSIKFIKSLMNLSNIIDPTASLPDFEEIHEVTNKISEIKSFLNIPYGKIFLQNSILFLIAIIVLFIIIYLGINILSKNRHEPFLIYKTALIVLVPALYFELFSIIISYLSLYIALGVAGIGVIISLGCLTIILKEKFLTDENNSVFIVSISFVLLTIVILMCSQTFLSSNLANLISSIKNISDIF